RHHPRLRPPARLPPHHAEHPGLPARPRGCTRALRCRLMKDPTLILIAGPNGAGKTTFATEILTSDLRGVRILHADEIARGLSPFDPASVAFKAGRILLNEISTLLGTGDSFALESTISGRGHAPILRHARKRGYKILIHFLWLPSPKESIARVKL